MDINIDYKEEIIKIIHLANSNVSSVSLKKHSNEPVIVLTLGQFKKIVSLLKDYSILIVKSKIINK